MHLKRDGTAYLLIIGFAVIGLVATAVTQSWLVATAAISTLVSWAARIVQKFRHRK
jgi:amino acid permease